MAIIKKSSDKKDFFTYLDRAINPTTPAPSKAQKSHKATSDKNTEKRTHQRNSAGTLVKQRGKSR